MVEKSPNLPAAVQQNIELFDRFISLSHYLLKTLLSSLSDALNIDEAHRFENSHRDEQPTNTTLVLLRYPKNSDTRNIGHNKHTDIGSLTLLFSNQWGLQVMTPEKKEWAFIKPRANHAIINVGDSLRFLSGKRLYSCVHRVIPVNGARQEEHRYSIAYFLRPESNVKFEDADGQQVSAVKWHDEKYVMFGASHEEQGMSKMLTGGMEQILVH
jgi:isopenicillin N synthase-like dioxygenase